MGMIGTFTWQRTLLDSYYSEPFSKRGVLHAESIDEAAVDGHVVRHARHIGEHRRRTIRWQCPEDDRRWDSVATPLLICAQPARHRPADRYIHEQIVRKRDEGKPS
jgi:hypothetical protein